MLKAWRMFYLVTMYILAAPLFAPMFIGVVVYDVVWCVRHKYYNLDSIKSGYVAFAQGLQAGHAVNMYWVKYGKKCPVIVDYGIKDES